MSLDDYVLGEISKIGTFGENVPEGKYNIYDETVKLRTGEISVKDMQKIDESNIDYSGIEKWVDFIMNLDLSQVTQEYAMFPPINFVVESGIDGVGKETQKDRKKEYYELSNIIYEDIDFPRYSYNHPSLEETKPAYLVELYLDRVPGKKGLGIDLDPETSSIFYAIDRFDAMPTIKKALKEGKAFISDRYISANKGHQGGKIKDETRLKNFLLYVNKLEKVFFGIIPPKTNIHYRLPAEVAMMYGKDNDAHELNFNHLKDAENNYLRVIAAEPENWEKIEGMYDEYSESSLKNNLTFYCRLLESVYQNKTEINKDSFKDIYSNVKSNFDENVAQEYQTIENKLGRIVEKDITEFSKLDYLNGIKKIGQELIKESNLRKSADLVHQETLQVLGYK